VRSVQKSDESRRFRPLIQKVERASSNEYSFKTGAVAELTTHFFNDSLWPNGQGHGHSDRELPLTKEWRHSAMTREPNSAAVHS
jgi:hypothetical protein